MDERLDHVDGYARGTGIIRVFGRKGSKRYILTHLDDGTLAQEDSFHERDTHKVELYDKLVEHIIDKKLWQSLETALKGKI